MRLTADPYNANLNPHSSYDATDFGAFHGKNKTLLELSREAVAMGLDKSILAKQRAAHSRQVSDSARSNWTQQRDLDGQETTDYHNQNQ